ncbi:hypothetical protein KPL76_06345 [Subtercola sp. PAMC28395]|uniref:hypothetical protein n=1 Tax=Subtercola sp. PAMC28395 TaxID=2846775 RepID=UPI001C0E2BA7|nr:hypothetical protein [Subtercola sp. PAMC28395]QWT24973.1 hypothetical protein KPL76_06345 [Subtercola sp. PAMC28395]
MTLAVRIYSKTEAQRITDDLKSAGVSARRSLDRLYDLMDEARNGNVWQVLGYASWTAYLAETLGGSPMRLPRDERHEVVSLLAGEGMSTRAIAPIVGVDQKTVARDIQGEANASPVAHRETRTTEASADIRERTRPPLTSDWVEPGPIVANTSTGEVIDAPVTTTETHTVKTVIGLDGKQYKQAPRESKPVITGDAVVKLNAETASISIGRALGTFLAFTNESHRRRILTEWWPLGAEAVPPANRELFNPQDIRIIAGALTVLANEMEATL